MVKLTFPFTQTKEQAKKAIINLFKNVDMYILEANVKYKKEEFEHIAIPITFAMEQLGQCRLILSKLKLSPESITFENSDNMFFHPTNIDRFKQELEISEDKKEWLDDVWRNSPFPIFDIDHVVDEFKHLYDDEMREPMNSAHTDRLKSAFVVFRNDGETILNTVLSKSIADTRIEAVEKIRKKLQTELESL